MQAHIQTLFHTLGQFRVANTSPGMFLESVKWEEPEETRGGPSGK